MVQASGIVIRKDQGIDYISLEYKPGSGKIKFNPV